MRLCKHDVISDTPVVSAFKGEHPIFLPDMYFKFRMQTVFQKKKKKKRKPTVSYSLY